jgi:cytoskeletal protein CcmA (bactofilin family)
LSVFGGKPHGDAGEGITLIGEEAFFHGNLSAKGSLRIEGVLEGDISDAVDVEVGARGRILGNVAAESLTVAGEVVGNVVVSRAVELLATARLSGDLRTPKLRIDEGASFEGTCAMGDSSDKPRRRRGKSDAGSEQTADTVSS